MKIFALCESAADPGYREHPASPPQHRIALIPAHRHRDDRAASVVAGEERAGAEDAPLCSAEDGRVMVEMISAVFVSHRLGGARVTFPLKTRVAPLSLP
jgi:hypothetical protein